MKIGFLTAPLPDTPLLEVADWAAANGFAALEVACWPRAGGEQRRYAGTSHIDCAALTQSQADELRGELAARGVDISGLGYYPNNLHPDLDHRAEVNEHTRAVIRAASLLGVPVVNTFIGADATQPLRANIAEAKTVWPDLVGYARDHGVKIAIENCPMIFSADEWPGGHNLMYAPATWREVFSWFDDTTLGLNLDPSHLVWQMIDIERAVAEFAKHIFHVHLKDMEIDRSGLYDHGVMSAGMGWQIPRLPGYGQVPWARFIAALSRHGYDGYCIIEHEDRGFEGTDDLVKRGFLIARNVVGPLLG